MSEISNFFPLTKSGPSAIVDAAHIGFSDEKLEALCRKPSHFELGFAPWASWEAENSSFGKTIRNWARFPSFLPLFISSDHGVHWESRCWDNETLSEFKTYFTWNQKKNAKMRSVFQKNSYHVPHPWVNYRKKYFPTLPLNRTGTLIYFPHSNQTTFPIFDDLEKYISNIKSLPHKYQPVVICLMSHDIEKGLHKELRRFDIPLVTSGNSSSQRFVDNFYSLLFQFRYATSPDGPPSGSHISYILEAGVPFFLYGGHVRYVHNGSTLVRNGEQTLSDYGDEEDINSMREFKNLLTIGHDSVTPDQLSFVNRYLGLDSTITRFKVWRVLWWSLIMNFNDFMRLYLSLFRQILKKFARRSGIYNDH